MKWFPDDVSRSGFVVDNLFYLALFLTSAAFAAVLVLLLYFLVRYRGHAGHKAFYTRGDSLKAVGSTIIFAIAVFFLIDVNLAFHDHAAWEVLWKKPEPGQALEILVEPEQFVWNARYAGPDAQFGTADDAVTVNDLHIPVDRPVLVSLKSKDVIHSFFLPNFRIKQDAVPGVITRLAFEAVKTGVYDIACAEHCGLGHYRMRGTLTVEAKEAFESWLSRNSKKENP